MSPDREDQLLILSGLILVGLSANSEYSQIDEDADEWMVEVSLRRAKLLYSEIKKGSFRYE